MPRKEAGGLAVENELLGSVWGPGEASPLPAAANAMPIRDAWVGLRPPRTILGGRARVVHQPHRMEWDANVRPSFSASSIARSSFWRASRDRRSPLVKRCPCDIRCSVQYNSASLHRGVGT